MTEKRTIGLIGVGLLGAAIAERLLANGIIVHGFDIDADRLAAFASGDGVAAENAAEVVRSCQTTVLSLPNSASVSSLLGQPGLELQAGQVVIDTSTGDPTQMVMIGKALAGRGAHYVEALVAGSSAQVRAGQAVLFVGGEDAVVTNAASFLDALTSTHFHLGPVGTASRFKLVHNLLLGLHRAVLAEGLTFAESLGFAPSAALEILQRTPAASAVMGTKGTRMVTGEFTPQARLSQHLKDVRLILAEAGKRGCSTPLSELHQTLLERAEDLGFGDADNCAIIEAFRSRRQPKSEP